MKESIGWAVVLLSISVWLIKFEVTSTFEPVSAQTLPQHMAIWADQATKSQPPQNRPLPRCPSGATTYAHVRSWCR